MRKKKSWHKLEFILPVMIVLPPVGLLLLWLSPQRRALKDTLTVLLLAFYALVGIVVWRTGYYTNFQEPPIPHSGYDITKDARGQYEISRVLPKERRIFNQVVEETRRIQKSPMNMPSQMDSSTIDDPEARAIEIVAERYGINSTDVQGIYMKVSSKLASR